MLAVEPMHNARTVSVLAAPLVSVSREIVHNSRISRENEINFFRAVIEFA